MTRSNWIRTGVVAGACTVIGAAAGIAGSVAAPAAKTGRSAQSTMPPRVAGERFGHHGRIVHAQEVVLNRAGTAYITVTQDSGTLNAAPAGGALDLREGVANLPPYNPSAHVVVPANATVYRNGAQATLADLKAGDQVMVSSSSEATIVIAQDAAHAAAGPGRFGPRRWGPDGRRGGPDGPPGAWDGAGPGTAPAPGTA